MGKDDGGEVEWGSRERGKTFESFCFSKSHLQALQLIILVSSSLSVM